MLIKTTYKLPRDSFLSVETTHQRQMCARNLMVCNTINTIYDFEMNKEKNQISSTEEEKNTFRSFIRNEGELNSCFDINNKTFLSMLIFRRRRKEITNRVNDRHLVLF